MNIEKIPLTEFMQLPCEKIAEIVRTQGEQVCVFPINGTRRWFLLEHGHESFADPMEAYLDVTGERHIQMYKLMFDHGLDALITPVFGGEILNRGDEYMEKIGTSMARLATHPDFLSFYQQYKVRVHFYGDYRKQLAGTSYSYLSDLFDHITKHTAHHNHHRLFYGVFASDATETIAEMSIRHFQNKNQSPTREELITQYYGEYLEKANIFIGFEKFNVFDYPLLGWGEESLYFTVAPSLYMSSDQLRKILYDYLYLRPVQDPDYFTMPPEDFETMRRFYEVNREVTFGVGEMRGGIWYPKSGIQE
jgi:tuberculosinol/isotuberculosinol synthase